MRLKISWMIRGERPMLKLVSRLVLEVLPYVLTALIAAVVVPGFISAQLHGAQPRGGSNSVEITLSAYEVARNNQAAYAGE
jgi:hypothetical protein